MKSKVWVQGGFEAEFTTEAKYRKAVEENPSLLHKFSAAWPIISLMHVPLILSLSFCVDLLRHAVLVSSS